MKYIKVVRPIYDDSDTFYSIIQDGRCAAFIARTFPWLYHNKFIRKFFRLTEDVTTQATYHPGKWTFSLPALHTMGYDLLVFRTLEDADNAIERYSWYNNAIFEVDVICPKTNLPPIRTATFRQTSGGEWPEGTIMAWGVKLGQRIQ